MKNSEIGFSIKENIKEILKNLPAEPGIYIMKDSYNNIIYVGKAKNLKNRVTSYFRGFASHMPKTQTLVVNISDIDYTITNSEDQALLLESNLIKKYKPKFNIRLKDDKSYPLIKITNEDYPRIIKVRKKDNDKGTYYGPYTSDYAVSNLIELIHQLYPIRNCNRDMTKFTKPCLNYHIKKCIGPCQYKDTKEQYNYMFEEIIMLLKGKQDDLISIIEESMQKHAQNLEFEKALILRNKLNSLKYLKEKTTIIDNKVDINQDILSFVEDETHFVYTIMVIREGKLLDKEHYIHSKDMVEDINELGERFILEYYSESQIFPDEILVTNGFGDIESIKNAIEKMLNKKIQISTPKRGYKKELLDLCIKNGEEYIARNLKKEKDKEERINKIIEQLNNILEIKSIDRVEAYDISNLYSDSNVGVMVVFEKGKKVPKDYRKFKIKGFEGQNDVGSLSEVINRRFIRVFDNNSDSFSKYPTILFIDGGKNQVNAVKESLDRLGLVIPVVGMVKDNKHSSNALFYEGMIFSLDKRSELYRFVYEIQEEVHRFAIDYHRNLRTKQVRVSKLDMIPGIGNRKKESLLRTFGSIETIKGLSIKEISKVKGINEALAKDIKKYLNSE